MPDYDFKGLSSFDFEMITRDLLQAQEGSVYESFTSGPDGGIDLRCMMSGKTIVQCKHFAGSGFKKLLSHIKSKELPKIKKLGPTRYVLATSVGLTPDNKDALVETLSPYCKGPHDILGKEDINNLLGLHAHVERAHFKLWLTSTAVLDRAINSGIFCETEVDIEAMKKKLRLYVQNSSLAASEALLDDKKFIVIAGAPGVGKTTLAEILLLRHIDKGYSAFRIGEDIHEAFNVLRSAERQIFYYDDFLGQTALELKLGKNEEHSLLKLVNHIRASKKTRLVLTTREYILKQAQATYEKLSQADSTLRLATYTIQVGDYGVSEKAKILFNHLYFSDLGANLKMSVLSNRAYWKIIKHRNFNPRLIEWMTDREKTMEVAPDEYLGRFLTTLEDPSDLWRHAFENQLKPSVQAILLVLATLPNRVRLQDLRGAFARHWGSADDFIRGLKELDGTFVRMSQGVMGDSLVTFSDPSVRDFLESRIYGDTDVFWKLVKDAVFFEQVSRLVSSGLTENHIQDGVRLSSAADGARALSEIERTLYSDSCELVSRQNSDGTSTTHLARLNVLSRLDLVYELADRGVAGSVDLIAKTLSHLIEERPLEGTSALATALLRAVSRGVPFASGAKIAHSLFSRVVSILDSELDEYSAIRTLVVGFEGVISEAEILHVGVVLERSAQRIVDRIISESESPEDIDRINGGLDELEEVANQLGVDLSASLEGGREFAADLASQLQDFPDDDRDDRIEPSIDKVDVDLMFDALGQSFEEADHDDT